MVPQGVFRLATRLGMNSVVHSRGAPMCTFWLPPLYDVGNSTMNHARLRSEDWSLNHSSTAANGATFGLSFSYL